MEKIFKQKLLNYKKDLRKTHRIHIQMGENIWHFEIVNIKKEYHKIGLR